MSDIFKVKMDALKNAFQQEFFIEENYCGLMIDNMIFNLSFNPTNDELIAYCILTSLEEKTEAEKFNIFRSALMGQYCFNNSDVFTFGVDPEEKMINFQMKVNLKETEDTVFIAMFEKFVNHSEAWSKSIEKALDAESESANNELPSAAFSEELGIKV